MLEVHGIDAFYGHIHALKDVSFSIREGEMVCVIGANGAGKSTLLKTLMSIVKPQKGSVRFHEREILPLRTHEIVRLGMGLVPERRQLFGPLSVLDNLKLGAYPWARKAGAAEIEKDLAGVYRLFPILKERHAQKAGTLSGGQQQMLAIGRALMSRVKLLLLDEPSLGLAPMVVLDIYRALIDLYKEGLTIALVEQNAQLALKVSQFGYILENGRISLKGRSADLLVDENVKQAYLGKKKEAEHQGPDPKGGRIRDPE
jgi:branched-chain amino acid transport system ATP-binding protein